LTTILQSPSDMVCLIFSSGDAIWQRFQFVHEISVDRHLQQIDRHTFNYLRAIVAICRGEPDSPIEYCRSLAWMQSYSIWPWFWSPCDQVRERLMGIRRSAQLFNEIVAVIAWKSLFLGCNQQFSIFGWHRLCDWWSKKLVKPCESQ
jgi:hypothetical protein